MKPPIKLIRMYAVADKAKAGDFVIVAEPLPAFLTAGWTEAQHIARRRAERDAIDAEWKKIRSRAS